MNLIFNFAFILIHVFRTLEFNSNEFLSENVSELSKIVLKNTFVNKSQIIGRKIKQTNGTYNKSFN